MPELPLYNQKQNINVNTPEPLRNEASQPFQDQKKVIGTLDNIASQWSHANDVMQSTEAKAKHSLAVNDIESRAAQDPDFKNSKAYHKELITAKEMAVKGIDNQQIASQLGLEFNYNTEIAKIKIDTNFRQKQIEYNKVMVQTNIDGLVSKKLSAQTESEKQHYDAEIINLIESNVQSGALDYKEADKIVKEAQNTAVKYDIYADSATQEDESQVLKDLKDHKGKYSFLPPDERLKLIEESQRRIFQNNQTMKKDVKDTQSEKYDSLIKDLSAGSVDLARIDQELKTPPEKGGIPVKQLIDIREGLIKGIEKGLKEQADNEVGSEEYNEVFQKVISDKVTLEKAQDILFKAYRDGNVDATELKVLRTIKAYGQDMNKKKDHDIFNSAVNGMVEFFTGKKTPTATDMALGLKSFVTRVDAGENPQDVANDIKRVTTLKLNPKISNFSPDGQLVIDENGILKIMNNLGEIRDVNSKAPAKGAK